ncbi:MAG: FAD-binding oxidoreductase [Leptospirales bacterium]|nr:FAD-binding oxidoreductase [Leptospirales bacterium]
MNLELLRGLSEIVGRAHLLAAGEDAEDDLRAWASDRTRCLELRPGGVVFPENEDQIVAIVRLCRQYRMPIVPSGGRTGLAGGAVAQNGELVLSLHRMDRILDFDPYLPAVRAQAGCITATLQQACSERGLLFPLDLAAAGASMLGGNLAANAGGIRVIGYGMLRDYVLGLRAVSGAGDILHFPGAILKNNTGFDLKHLWIGSEGVLGIILEATIRLAAQPTMLRTAMAAHRDLRQSLDLLARLRSRGARLLAFEIFDREALAVVRRHLQLPAPFGGDYPCYALLEWDAERETEETLLAECLEAELAEDVQIASSSAGRQTLWKYRESISECLSMGPPLHKYDLSVPIAALPDFVARCHALLAAKAVRPVFFGHAGDGNIHLNLVQEEGISAAGWRTLLAELDATIFTMTAELGGSISAEHGIGILKREWLSLNRSSPEIALMKTIKGALDPDGIMNPGKMLPD